MTKQEKIKRLEKSGYKVLFTDRGGVIASGEWRSIIDTSLNKVYKRIFGY